jgi:hypothetical protein
MEILDFRALAWGVNVALIAARGECRSNRGCQAHRRQPVNVLFKELG